MGTGNPGRRGRQGTCVEILSTLRRHSANLLPAAKFVSNGFLINQLGQVDLRLAPQNIRQSVSLARPLILHRMFGLTVEDVWEMMKESPHGERYMEKLLSVEIFGIV